MCCPGTDANEPFVYIFVVLPQCPHDMHVSEIHVFICNYYYVFVIKRGFFCVFLTNYSDIYW